MERMMIQANDVRLNIGRTGSGRPLLLLHGWPEFWRTRQPVMERLSDEFCLIAPDLRGFGESDKPNGDHPSDQAGAAVHGEDMLSLLDALGLEKVGLVAHDVDAIVAQDLARRTPQRIAGVFCFDCPYPGGAP
jgi:pimeloyl-ACP methyl ester carboxylesterase